MNLEKIYEEISNEIKAMTDDEIKEVSDILYESKLLNVD